MADTGGDKIVFNYDTLNLAVEMSNVEKIVETERIFLLPLGSVQKGFLKGTISHKGGAVAVIDLPLVFGLEGTSQKGPSKVVVVRDSDIVLGLKIGNIEPTFIWKDKLDEAIYTEVDDRYTSAIIELEGRTIKMVDWKALYEEAAQTMAS